MKHLGKFSHAKTETRRICGGTATFVLALVLFSAGCQNKPEAPGATAQPKMFASPSAAADALYAAAKSGDSNSVLSIFPAEAKDYLVTGDAERR